MAKTNYSYEKRQQEIKKQKKRQEKLQKKQEKKRLKNLGELPEEDQISEGSVPEEEAQGESEDL